MWREEEGREREGGERELQMTFARERRESTAVCHGTL